MLMHGQQRSCMQVHGQQCMGAAVHACAWAADLKANLFSHGTKRLEALLRLISPFFSPNAQARTC